MMYINNDMLKISRIKSVSEEMENIYEKPLVNFFYIDVLFILFIFLMLHLKLSGTIIIFLIFFNEMIFSVIVFLSN